MPPIPFAYQAYESRALPFSAQRLINLFAEPGPPEAKSRVALHNVPGIGGLTSEDDFFVDLGFPNRGAGVLKQKLYMLSGDNLFQVDKDGTTGNVGTIPNADRVQVASNGEELLFLTNGRGYLFDPTNMVREITDANFKTASSVTSQDGFFIFTEADSAGFFISKVFNGFTYEGTDASLADGSPDDLVACTSHHRELWLHGELTTEVWYNNGSTDFPFSRINGVHIERGLGAVQSRLIVDNTLYLLGDDRIVYRFAGYNPQRISTHAIELKLSEMSKVSDAYAMLYDIAGHKHYVLTFPTGGFTFVYDVATNLWHERRSVSKQGYWIGNVCIPFHDRHYVGAFNSGKVGILDWNVFKEFGDDVLGETVSPPIHKDRKNIFISRFELDLESGVGLDGTQTTVPEWALSISRDGGKTYGQPRLNRSVGDIGEHRKRQRWLRLGKARDWAFKLTTSAPVKRSILNAHADWRIGTS